MPQSYLNSEAGKNKTQSMQYLATTFDFTTISLSVSNHYFVKYYFCAVFEVF